MKTFPYPTRRLVFFLWLIAVRIRMAANSSLHAQKLIGAFALLEFCFHGDACFFFIRLDNKHVVFGKVIDGMLTVSLITCNNNPRYFERLLFLLSLRSSFASGSKDGECASGSQFKAFAPRHRHRGALPLMFGILAVNQLTFPHQTL